MRSCHECGVRYTENDTFCASDGSALVEHDDGLLGETLGKYRVVRMLGHGGMGQVYLGLNPRIGSRVAIKVLSPAAAADKELVERFFREAKLVNRIRHEGIVNVFDLDELPDGRPYITMECLDGEPLSATIRRGPMTLHRSAAVAIEILDALQAAHDTGVVHRDLKPDNIFMTPQGRVKLLDFGIAKLMPTFDATSATPNTKSGALLGTPGYMAPEQVLGDPITGATDLYAVGAILYQAVTGTMAFEGDTLFELLSRIVSDEPVPPRQARPELTGPFEDLILRSLSKLPAQRPASARLMRDELRGIQELLGSQPALLLPQAYGSSSHASSALTSSDELPLGLQATQHISSASSATAATMAPSVDEALPGATRSLRKIPRQPAGTTTLRDSPSSVVSRGQGAVDPPRHKSSSRTPIIVAALVLVGAGLATALLVGDESGPRLAASALDAGPGDAAANLALVVSDGGAAAPAAPPIADSVPKNTVPEQPVERGRDEALRTPDRKLPSKLPTKETEGGSEDRNEASKPPVPTPPVEGSQPPSSRIHLAPDYNVKAFDAAAYVPKARALAKRIYSDAQLIEFDIDGVGPNGKANLAMLGVEATYNFLSKSHSARTLPIGIDEDRPCWVYVEVDKNGVTARIVERDTCKGKARPNPRCSLKEVWDRAYQFGAPKSGAVAGIDYLWDGWFFDIDALGVTESIKDDC